MSRSRVAVSIDGAVEQNEKPSFEMHRFVEDHQLLSGVVFSLLSLALSIAVIVLVAAIPHQLTTPSNGTGLYVVILRALLITVVHIQ